jgi:site-specific DNA recombinase
MRSMRLLYNGREKEGRYVYYRCTGFKGACGNTYIREERLSDLLGETIQKIQITSEIAERIATALRESDGQADQQRREAIRCLEQRQRAVTAKLD